MNRAERARRYKEMALDKINPILECAECGCDDIRILEINHINADGKTDRKTWKSGPQLHLAIINGQRGTNDLNILCKACNIIHYLKHRYGPLLPIRAIWRGI